MLDLGLVYDRMGADGMARLVRAFYAQVPEDPILGPLYPPHDLAGAEQRLLGFLTYRMGGPPTYVEERGHPRLRQRHAPFPIDRRARDRWVELMERALEESLPPPDAAEALRAFFAETATFLINRA